MRLCCSIALLCINLAVPPNAFANSGNGSAGRNSDAAVNGNAGENRNAVNSGNAGGGSGNSSSNSSEGSGVGNSRNVGSNTSGSSNSGNSGGSVSAAGTSANQGRAISQIIPNGAAILSSGSSTLSGVPTGEPDVRRSRSKEVDTSPNAWGTTSARAAREAVAQGVALPLRAILPTVSKRAPGQVLEVDLRQSPTGAWQYELLVLTNDRRYQIVIVDAKLNQVTHVRIR
jgi:hypothetical protein